MIIPSPGFHYTQEKDFLKITYWKIKPLDFLNPLIFIGLYAIWEWSWIWLNVPKYIYIAIFYPSQWWSQGGYAVFLTIFALSIAPFFALLIYLFIEGSITSTHLLLNKTTLRVGRFPSTWFNRKQKLTIAIKDIETTFVDKETHYNTHPIDFYTIDLILTDESVVSVPFVFINEEGIYASRVALMIEDFVNEQKKKGQPRKKKRKKNHLANKIDEHKDRFGWELGG